MSNEYKDWINEFTSEQLLNMTLCHKYPILLSPEDEEKTEYLSTQLDSIPEGWRNNFGEQLLADLQSKADSLGLTEDFYIVQMKEKYGSLRVYVSQYNSEIEEIISHYEHKSVRVCASCGRELDTVNLQFGVPYCFDCAKKITGRKHTDDEQQNQ